jgi:GNAT superfamily N-acetyltransferase
MDKEYEIVYVEKPEEAAWGIIGKGIRNFNVQQAGDQKFQRLCFALRSPDQEIFGGCLGEIHWDWLHLDLLWIKEELRGQGYGHRLLVAIEDEARRRGAKNVFLDTFSFQAPDFYKQHGYRVFGILPEFPPGHQRFFLRKEL